MNFNYALYVDYEIDRLYWILCIVFGSLVVILILVLVMAFVCCMKEKRKYERFQIEKR